MPVYQSEPTKDGRSYYFLTYKKDYEGNNKKYKSKRYKLKREAEAAERAFLMKKNDPFTKPFMIVADDYFNYISKIRKESTIYTYKKDFKGYIEPYFKKLDINTIDVKKIRDWASIIDKKEISVNYKNKIYNILKCIFDYAIKNYGLTLNPVSMYGRFQEKQDKVIKDEEKLRYITFEEFNQFISYVSDLTWKTFFIFLYYTGCRRGEVQALKISDVDFSKNEIIINKTLYEEVKGKVLITSTKNNRNRKIKMSKTLRNQLLEYLEYMKNTYSDYNNNWYLFGGLTYLPKTTISRKKHQYFKESGVKEITIHEFRHSHVSLLINEYIKSNQTDTAKFFLMMSNRMGHTIDVMQKTYMHLFDTVQDEIVDLLDNL